MFWQRVNVKHNSWYVICQVCSKTFLKTPTVKKILKPSENKTKWMQTKPPKLTCSRVPWTEFCLMPGAAESGSPRSRASAVCGTSVATRKGTRARPDISRQRYTGLCPHLQKPDTPVRCRPASHQAAHNWTKDRAMKPNHISHKSNTQTSHSHTRATPEDLLSFTSSGVYIKENKKEIMQLFPFLSGCLCYLLIAFKCIVSLT